MIGPITDAGTSMEIVATTATTVLVAAVAPTLAELAWNEINRSRIRKEASSSTMIYLSKTMKSLRSLRGGGGIGSVDSKRKTKTGGNKKQNITIEPKKKKPSHNSPINDDDDNTTTTTTTHNKDLATRGKSVAFMALGMALHYLGYSLARPITVALFTSKATGYPGTPGAFPFAMAFVSPISLVCLLWYGSILEKHGPRGALERTTLACAFSLLGASGAIELAQRSNAVLWKTSIPVVKLISGPLFVFRESYVQLLTSQYWSFMSSVLTPNESAKWFAPIAGLTSISSVLGGTAVSYLSERLKLSGTLACTSLALLVSLLATGKAYSIAEKNGFSPKPRQKKKIKVNKKQQQSDGHNGEDHEGVRGLIVTAKKLFARVPVLKALFVEILASQSLATLLNVCFVASVARTIPDDTIRAGWVGNFYALINVFSMTLQFAVLPFLMQYIEPKDLWRFTPLISLGFTTFQAFQKNPTLYAISASLLVMKVSEYSARRMLDEMVYVPLDFESRFLGKEIIGVFGYRFGKSVISLSLSALTSVFGQFDLQTMSVLSDLAAVGWARTAWNLSSLVPTRKEAQASYDKNASKNGKNR